MQGKSQLSCQMCALRHSALSGGSLVTKRGQCRERLHSCPSAPVSYTLRVEARATAPCAFHLVSGCLLGGGLNKAEEHLASPGTPEQKTGRFGFNKMDN